MNMRPKIVCPVCSQELNPDDKFCSSCGTKIEWDKATPSQAQSQANAEQKSSVPSARSTQNVSAHAPTGASLRCPLCGNENKPGDTNCRSCGAVIARTPGAPRPSKKDQHTGTSSPMSALQSWKLTAGMAVLLVIVLVAVKLLRTEGSIPQQAANQNQMQQGPVSQQNNSGLISEIDDLQKKVDANQNDAEALIQLANRLQDAKFLPRAVTTYQRYLSLKPDDPNARVDLGVCYYELSMSDSNNRGEHIAHARASFESALKLDPKHQLAQYNLGIVSLLEGNMEGASEWFKKAAATDPNSETGKRAQMLMHQHTLNNKPSS